jgi:ABC-2 type transport system permease protein
MIWAILWAQWLSMRAFRLGSRRRGAVFSLLTALVWYGFWTMLALAAQGYMAEPNARAQIEAGLPRGLMFIFLYWQLAPIVSASLGASLDLKKLLVYPIPHQKLFLVEVLLRLTTCAEMLLVLAGTVTGLLRNAAFGGWMAAPRVVASSLVFVAFNLLLAAGLRNLLERLLLHKRLREIMVLLLALAAALPQLVLVTGVPSRTVRRLFAGTPYLIWPWSGAARVALGQDFFGAWAVLIGWAALAWLFGRRQFERSLRYDAQAAQATEIKTSSPREEPWTHKLYRVPSLLLPDPIGAIVEKELRSLSRTPRFRLVFIMGFSFGLLIWFPLVLRRRSGSALAENFLTVVSLYALTLLGQVSYWTAFGFDRSAAQVYFSLPVPIWKALAGKNLAAAAFILLEMAAVILACLLLRVHVPRGKILEAFLVTLVVGFYLLSAGNLSSVHFPRAMNPERVAQGGSASRFQALMFFFYPVALLPVGLAYAARYAFESQTAFYLVLAFAAVLGGVVYWIAMDSAVSAAQRRREMLLQELSRSEGPVVTE